jgi:nitronate monooxygenase
MGGVGSTALAVSVARAGGLAMLPVLGDVPVVQRVTEVRASGVVGVNVLMPFAALQVDAIEGAVAAGARVVEFFYDDPQAALVERVHDAGALACWQTGSLDEARAAVDAGCDLVVVQGVEAGGHVRGTVPLDELLGATVDADLGVPVVAAGGIATRERVQEVLRAGADAVRIGTRFVATPEADAHPGYRRGLVDAGSGDTVLTTAFGNGWPDAPHRVLASSVDAAERLPDDAPARFSPNPPTSTYRGDPMSAALYAGTGVGEITSIEPADDIVTRLFSD